LRTSRPDLKEALLAGCLLRGVAAVYQMISKTKGNNVKVRESAAVLAVLFKQKAVAFVSAFIVLIAGSQLAVAGTTVYALPVGNTAGSADYAPGFAPGSWQGDATVAGTKAEYYVSPAALFGGPVTIGQLASISYFTNKDTTHAVDASDWYLVIYTVANPALPVHGSWYGNRINSEPYFSQNIVETAGTWTQWVTDAGENNRLRFFDSTSGYFGSYTDGFLSDLTANPAYANQEILAFSIQTGSAWAPGFDGLVDGLEITLTNADVGQVNFVAAPVPEPLTMASAFFAIGGLGTYIRRRTRALVRR